jgi:GntR family transcriptional regulator, transcriptional repressor for pyruvate dehydrogenase complex
MDAPPNTNIAATVYRDLRRQILSGELPAGARLPGERELAAKYGTNRNTLREAVRRLEQTRLVTVRHGQGVTVTDFRRTGTMELMPAFLETAGDMGEVVHMLEDILPARLLVIEFASRLAVRRATESDCQRLQDITDLLIAAFDRGDPVLIAHGFQRWLDAIIDAGHSVSIRWIANPFLEAYREIMDRFPALWVLESSFPQHLRDFLGALLSSDEERMVQVTRGYYERIDQALLNALDGALQLSHRSKPPASRSDAPAAAANEGEPSANDEPS